MVAEKWCPGCERTRPAAEYYRRSDLRSGLSTRCKLCLHDRRSGRDARPYRSRADVATRTAKRCGACGLTKPLEAFARNRCYKDGREYQCRECHNGLRAVRVATAARERIADANLLDTLDRSERRSDLSEIGGICGVREIRARYRRLRSAKERCRGEEIPADVLDAILPTEAACSAP